MVVSLHLPEPGVLARHQQTFPGGFALEPDQEKWSKAKLKHKRPPPFWFSNLCTPLALLILLPANQLFLVKPPAPNTRSVPEQHRWS